MSPLGKPATQLMVVVAALALSATGQDLAPRAYVISPMGSNAITVSYAFNDGAILLDPTIPIEDLQGRFSVPILGYYRSFGLFGRSANVAVALPYGVGNFSGVVIGQPTSVYRSGLADGRVRVAVNLRGGRAMSVPEFIKYRERTVIGASLTVIVPTGQYDPARLINPGAHRVGFKPEVGLTRRLGRWAWDGYGGLWVFTENPTFFPGNSIRKQNMITSLEFHLGYYLRPRAWVSFDSNFWVGGNTVVNGVENQDRARNSRVGGTISLPLSRHNSLKFSASTGAIVRVGGNFTTITAGWQYSWLTKPK